MCVHTQCVHVCVSACFLAVCACVCVCLLPSITLVEFTATVHMHVCPLHTFLESLSKRERHYVPVNLGIAVR